MVLVATHSQGSIVSTHLIARLISDGHIRTKSNRQGTFITRLRQGAVRTYTRNCVAVNHATEQTGVLPPIAPHRVCCLAMCGIHMGPLYSLNSSSLAQPYLQWFESQAARELFEFQVTMFPRISCNILNLLVRTLKARFLGTTWQRYRRLWIMGPSSCISPR